MDNKKTNNNFIDKLNKMHLSLERIFAAFISSFMIAYIITLLSNDAFYELQTYYNSINFVLFFMITIVSTGFLCLATYSTKSSSLIPRALLFSTFVLSCIYSAAYSDGGVYFLIGIAVVDLIVILWLTKDNKLELNNIKLDYKLGLIVAGILFVATTIYFGYYTSLKYQNFYNATFDFGIFAQMFENMATTGLPLTTVERSMEMSHFGVHFSPIFYLLLPGYMIFRTPIYLFYAQSACVALGVFAVYLICKKLEISPKVTLCFELIYCFYPCLFNGCFYDFHENKMLTTIILFLFYFIISEKRLAMIGFALLLLMVKEDAAIYLIAISLYVLMNKKKYLDGAIMLSMAVVYFLIANKIVAAMGTEGVMMWRLDDYFVNGEQTYGSVFKSILFDAGYLIKMMFTAEKLPFIIWMFMPVAFAPFFTKKISSLVLLLPIIPINLMQSWKYQYDINFQYTYGVAALIIFSAIVCIANLKKRPRHIALLMSLMMCACMTLNTISPKIENNTFYEDKNGEITERVEEALDTINKDASVTASHYIAPHLYDVRTLYTVPDYNKENKEILKTDYFVVDTRYPDDNEEIFADMGKDYELINSTEFVEIYKHK